MVLQNLIDEAIDIGVKNLKKEKNIKRIKEEILKPMIDYIACELRPYIIATCLFVAIVISMLIVIVVILSRAKN